MVELYEENLKSKVDGNIQSREGFALVDCTRAPGSGRQKDK